MDFQCMAIKKIKKKIKKITQFFFLFWLLFNTQRSKWFRLWQIFTSLILLVKPLGNDIPCTARVRVRTEGITLSGCCCCTVYTPHFSSVSQILSLFSSAKKLWFHCVDYTLHMKSTRKSPNRPTDPKSQQQKQACALSEVMVYRLWNFFLGGNCDWRCPIPADVKNESRLMILIPYS